MRRKVEPNITVLGNALKQQGPWAGREMEFTGDWFVKAIRDVIEQIDWNTARSDVQRFLPIREQESLDEWSVDFFLYQAERLNRYLSGTG